MHSCLEFSKWFYERGYYSFYFTDEGSKTSQILSHMINKKQNKDMIQIFHSKFSAFSTMLSCHVRSERVISFVVGDKNPKPVNGIKLDRKPGSSRSRTLAMQPNCILSRKRWPRGNEQCCSPNAPPDLTHTHTHTPSYCPFQSTYPMLFWFLILSEKLRVENGGGGRRDSTREVSSKSQWVPIARIKLCALTSFIFFPFFGLPLLDFSRLPCKNKLSALEFVWC